MSEYAPGTEHTFSAMAAIKDGDIEGAVREASALAQRKQDVWGRHCPQAVAELAWKYGYELMEKPGLGWFVEVVQSIRLYSLEESITLPGEWGQGEETN